MYKIDRTDLGFQLTFGGDMTEAEIHTWYQESARVLAGMCLPFGVIIDMRTLAPLPVGAQAMMIKGQAMYRSRGMQRSCVILDDPITTIQFMRLAKESGIFKYERYIDASVHEDWRKTARNWVRDAVSPPH
ncbi:MAG: hypothetical protein ABSF72_14745 [Candidatus Sulfotelmatobacter sp.]